MYYTQISVALKGYLVTTQPFVGMKKGQLMVWDNKTLEVWLLYEDFSGNSKMFTKSTRLASLMLV